MINTESIIQFLSKTTLEFILKTKRFKSAESIIIFSEPRGGSTWLMEIMSELLPVCINWEPLHADKGVIPKTESFGIRPFISTSETKASYYKLFKKIHEFKIHSSWTKRFLDLKTVYNSKFVLTKYVRANMLVPYLMKNFEFKHNPIFLIRHPIDTCISQIKAFGGSKSIIQPKMYTGINSNSFLKHSSFLNTLESDLEWYVASWCIINGPTLKQLNTDKLCVVYYSDLLLNPKEEVNRILKETNLQKFSKNIDELNFTKPSSTDFNKNLKDSPQTQLNKNFDSLDLKTKDKIQTIFDYFEIKLFSAYSSEPQKTTLQNKALLLP